MSYAKIEIAKKLIQNPSNENFSKGLTIFNQLCLSTSLPPDDKLKTIIVFIKIIPDSGLDMLIRWRDMIPFLDGKELQDLIDLLTKVTRCSDLDPHERLVTAVTLYNNGFIDICYPCFADLTCDQLILTDYRVDAARYLFAAGTDEYNQMAQEALLEIIDTDTYPSEYRYKIIAGFISRTGINTMMNMIKIRIPYDEEFVYGLQTNFFYNDQNSVRERILSGQHMLEMEIVEPNEKIDICNILIEIAQDKRLEDNIRADAADVVLRVCKGEQRKTARQIIVDLGFDAANRNKKTGSLMDHAHTIYNDSQNIHGFTDQIDRFIEKIITETNIHVKPYHEVTQAVSNIVRKLVTDKENMFKAHKALNRINIDTAKFTKHKVTLAEIFIHVWARIQNYTNEEIRVNLEERLVEELIDMGDTCSSGHSGRFVNILSTYDETLKISWDEQIKANVIGRMNASIRDCPDQNIRARLAMAQSELADEEDRKVYIEFIQKTLPKIKEELYKEFVGEGYITKEEFEKAFEQSTVSWLN
uniref:Uncharacterized protein n=1 Tax=Marseillevirus LCMAC102 TaxID=2506603 RepID=A0A481YVC5_9VIRU|nr:MAG: uncharacterized protein LCMAC102_02990 [Marseillevirus LCMAC102]